MTIPSLVHSLCTSDDVVALSRATVVQAMPLHKLLVQLAAIAVERAGGLPDGEGGWREALAPLTRWELYGGFLQPTDAPSGRAKVLDRPGHLSPYGVRGVEAQRRPGGVEEDWLFALVEAQTHARYGGRGLYGASRMNGGWGARVAWGWRPSLRWPACVRHDLAALIAARDSVAERYGYRATDGLAVVADAPWGQPLSLGDLDPWYIDTARRVWLRQGVDGIVALREPSGGVRLAAPGGATGDPWAGEIDGSLVGIGPRFRQMKMMETLLDPRLRMGCAVDPRFDAGQTEGGGRLFVDAALWDGGRSLGLNRWSEPLPPIGRALFAARTQAKG